MSDVTPLEEKLGEVIGLAEAAQATIEKVTSLPEADSQSDLLERLGQESEETAERARKVADQREGDTDGVREASLRLAAEEDPDSE
jgi:hypothetical protein